MGNASLWFRPLDETALDAEGATELLLLHQNTMLNRNLCTEGFSILSRRRSSMQESSSFLGGGGTTGGGGSPYGRERGGGSVFGGLQGIPFSATGNAAAAVGGGPLRGSSTE